MKLACVCGVVLLAGCDGSRPASMPSTPTPPVGATHTVFGVVQAGGVPVAGAVVVVLGQDHQQPVTSDSNGYYSVRTANAQPWGMSPLVSASKPGYFTDTRFTDANYTPISRDTRLDFELDPLTRISLGEVVRGRAAGAVCSHWGYGASSCGRVALTVPSSGTLEVTVSAPIYDFDLDIVRPDGTFALYNPTWVSPSRNRISVEAGLTYQIRLAGRSPREFELTTALR